MRKILSGLLAIIMLFSMVGCNLGNPGGGGITVINIMNTGGGIGRKWLDDAIVRYQKDNPNIKFNVEHNIDTGVGTMATSGYSIYFVEQGGIGELAASGKLLDITDILTEKSETRDGNAVSIVDKIRPEAVEMMKGYDGKYYAVPHFTIFSGMSYDYDLFTERGYFFADYNAEVKAGKVTNFVSPYGNAKFVAPGNTEVAKSVGNDGIAGTYDDGLPTTLVELCILCAKMYASGTTPIEHNGTVDHYVSSLLKGLWASTDAGKGISAFFDYSGQMEVVTGFDNTQVLFTGATDSISKPITEMKTITEETGYLTYQAVSKYYSVAFIQMMLDKGWISEDYTSKTVTPGIAQLKFICNGQNEGDRTYGMLVEASHWYNEAEFNGSFKQYDLLTGETGSGAQRDLRWMPLPTDLDEPVTGPENARGNVMTQASDSYAFINANIAANTNLVKEVKKFFKFLYSDAELSHFTGETGILRGHINYDLTPEDEAKLSSFDDSIFQMYRTANVSLNVSKKQSYLRNASTLLQKATWPTYKGSLYHSIFSPFSYGGKSPEVYQGLTVSKTDWESTYYVAD